ncbi:hypothetical protein [Lacimicrobium alkaliphilum]|uniref:Restriction endonuclease type II NotI domain-containing protein n=1 Tax=Lacimicrobium alkaliphilum TaxID=1526571 RepID=A0ABQ1RGY4_9ALTE|nr:hypothetical protein [Lacimicrobium alkaliphilum]GGD70055.1 hypothetical protein GCM10011357_26330 [Lacimicrobium alkaliphilum]
MIEIVESGMTFGPFQPQDLYQVEKSDFLPRNVKSVEFIWITPEDKKLLFVEAKSSFSSPGNVNDFSKNLQNVYIKMLDSLILLSTSKIGRHADLHRDLPDKFHQIDWSRIDIHFRLVVPEFRKEWLGPITDALRREMKHFLSSFNISTLNLRVINREIASKEGLLRT